MTGLKPQTRRAEGRLINLNPVDGGKPTNERTNERTSERMAMDDPVGGGRCAGVVSPHHDGDRARPGMPRVGRPGRGARGKCPKGYVRTRRTTRLFISIFISTHFQNETQHNTTIRHVCVAFHLFIVFAAAVKNPIAFHTLDSQHLLSLLFLFLHQPV